MGKITFGNVVNTLWWNGRSWSNAYSGLTLQTPVRLNCIDEGSEPQMYCTGDDLVMIVFDDGHNFRLEPGKAGEIGMSGEFTVQSFGDSTINIDVY